MSHGRRISVIGLGYVGLPVAVAFGKIGPVIGFDINPKRIKELKSGHDRTMEVPVAELKTTDVKFSSEVSALKAADFHIIAVPTPIVSSLSAARRASSTVSTLRPVSSLVSVSFGVR